MEKMDTSNLPLVCGSLVVECDMLLSHPVSQFFYIYILSRMSLLINVRGFAQWYTWYPNFPLFIWPSLLLSVSTADNIRISLTPVCAPTKYDNCRV